MKDIRDFVCEACGELKKYQDRIAIDMDICKACGEELKREEQAERPDYDEGRERLEDEKKAREGRSEEAMGRSWSIED